MNMDEQLDIIEAWQAERVWVIGDDVYMSHKLMFHYALLVNPNRHGYEHRYCYKNLGLMCRAMREFEQTGKLRHWHKDHTNNISVNGSHLYEQGMLQEPEYAIGEVDWVVHV